MYLKTITVSTALIMLFFAGITVSAKTVKKLGNNSMHSKSSTVNELESNTTRLSLPRMTQTEMNAIASPKEGLMIYCTTYSPKSFFAYNGGVWVNLTKAAARFTNGTAAVSSYTNVSEAGTMTEMRAVSLVSQTISANVTSIGTYNLRAKANGVTFAGSGTFARTGPQNIVITATGTPTAAIDSPFTYITYTLDVPKLSFIRAVSQLPNTVYVAPGIIKTFMSHNLGADLSLDPSVPVQGIHGSYYQWGRFTVVADASTASGAISGWNTMAAASDAWLDSSKTANDPCPTGFRVPTKAQWEGVMANNTASRTGSFTAGINNFGSALHFGPDTNTKRVTLPASGIRDNNDGNLAHRGYYGYYWSSTGYRSGAYNLDFSRGNVSMNVNYNRTYGLSVRCISE